MASGLSHINAADEIMVIIYVIEFFLSNNSWNIETKQMLSHKPDVLYKKWGLFRVLLKYNYSKLQDFDLKLNEDRENLFRFHVKFKVFELLEFKVVELKRLIPFC